MSASVLQVGGASAMDQVRLLVRDREVLRPGFTQAWQRLAQADAAVAEEWASATLELLRVNAGPSCIGAFWRAGEAAGPGLLQPVLAGGRAAAGVCRHAGARAALGCLEALPAAIRLTRGNPAGLAAWWHGLDRLAREAPGLVQGVARQVEVLLAGGDGMSFVDFVAAGLKATVNDKARRAAFFRLDDPLAKAMLLRRTGAPGFADCERMLAYLIHGMAGIRLRVSRKLLIAFTDWVSKPSIYPITPSHTRHVQRHRRAVPVSSRGPQESHRRFRRRTPHL